VNAIATRSKLHAHRGGRKTIEETEAQKKSPTSSEDASPTSRKRSPKRCKERDAKLVERGRSASVRPVTLRRYEQCAAQGQRHRETIDGTCLSCHMRCLDAFQKLMRRAFEQCPSCARILYYEAPADEHQGGTS
jgi:hypothetical protein